MAAWCVKALGVGALIWVAMVVIASGWNPLRRLSTPVADAGSADLPVKEGGTAGHEARAEVARLGGGAYLGTSGGRWVTADRESAVMVLGPPRSGKTSAVMIPAVMSAPGPVISTSTRSDVMRATLAARSEIGRAWLFDPAGSEGGAPPEGVKLLRWSPVAAAGGWDGAKIMARAMTRASTAGAGTTDATHWSERATALLAPLLHAAALAGLPIGEVVGWVLRHDLHPAQEILARADAAMAADVLVGIEATDTRERSSIFSAAAGVLAAYTSDAVAEGAATPNFDPVRFAESRDTIYVTAAEERQELCAPLIVGMLQEVRQARYALAAEAEEEGRDGGPPMLWALDEVANIAPVHDLPAVVSQAGGQGLQLLVGLQDMSQARARWGVEVAEGFLSLFQTKLVLDGIGDAKLLEGISEALGEYDREVVSRTRGRSRTDEWLRRSPDQYSDSVTWQTQRQRVLTPGNIAALPPGRGLLLRGARWSLIGVPRWFAAEPWRRPAPSTSAGLLHEAGDGTMVRSKSELVILETLLGMGLEPRYEERLDSRSGGGGHRLPDFTVTYDGVTFYWEHLGMLDRADYMRAWERKRAWYERNGFADRVITSADAPGQGLSVPEVRARAERRILRGEPREGEPGFAASPAQSRRAGTVG